MTETLGNRVAVFRRKIPLLRAAIFFALVFALVTGVAIVLTRGPDTDLFGYAFAYVISWSLVMASLWLIRSISKVTIFEGGIRGPTGGHRIVITEPLDGMPELKELVRRLAGEDHPFTRLLYGR